MARRKDHTREELLELAVRTGRELVAAEGTEALTARNVAKLMGYAPGTLYNLFENIDGLVAEINARTLEDFADGIDRILRKYGKPRKRMEKICAAYLKLQERQPHLWTLCFATPLKARTEAYHRAVHRVFDPVTEALLPLSGGRQSARRDAKILWSTLHGICLLRKSGKFEVGGSDPAEVLVERFLDRFLQ